MRLAPAPTRVWLGELVALGPLRHACMLPAPEAGGDGRAEAGAGQRRPVVGVVLGMPGLGHTVARAHAGAHPRGVGPLTEEESKHPWFKLENLTTFSQHQVVDWDETHQELVMLGGAGRAARGKELQTRFCRMPGGQHAVGEAQPAGCDWFFGW